MSDYKTTDLDEFGMPKNSPITAGTVSESAYEYRSTNERNSVGDYNLQNFNFGKGQGGTLVLGGTANGNGVLQIKNSVGTVIIQGDNAGHTYYGTSGIKQIVMDANGFTAYSTDGSTPVYAITKDGFFSYGTAENLINLRENTASTVSYGQLGFSTTYGHIIQSGDNKNMSVWGNNNTNIIASGTLALLGYASGTAVEIFSDTNMLIGADSIQITGSGGNVNVDASGKFYVDAGGDIDFTCDNFVLNGSTKTAIVPTTKGYKALYCTESPEVWFMDFCTDKNMLDPLFVEVTEPPYHYIKCEDGGYQVWGKRKGFASTRFEDKTLKQFTDNNSIWSGRRAEELNDRIKEVQEHFEAMKPNKIAQLENKLDNKLDKA